MAELTKNPQVLDAIAHLEAVIGDLEKRVAEVTGRFSTVLRVEPPTTATKHGPIPEGTVGLATSIFSQFNRIVAVNAELTSIYDRCEL